jgi:Rad52/22 family double-strand break repair protein
MALSNAQIRQLSAKLEARHVKTRNSNGTNLHYVEGWHVIAEANRIFGYDAWDRRTLATSCVWTSSKGQVHAAAYIAKVRISVRAGETTIVREGSGTCECNAPTPGQAHELALKGAETDATKRALATFGNPFGLALYDREQTGVRKSRGKRMPAVSSPWILRSSSGMEQASCDKPSEFATALRRSMSEAGDIEILFAIWEQNVDTVRAINRSLKQDHLPTSGIAPQLVAHLKQCAIALVKPPATEGQQSHETSLDGSGPKIDKSLLTISELKRHRSKEHLQFVSQHPCIVCGRAPSHAHHVRFAQSKGIGLKVSDEFTVPLCALHHSDIHTTGDERSWWKVRNIDPLEAALKLWEESRKQQGSAGSALASPAQSFGSNKASL